MENHTDEMHLRALRLRLPDGFSVEPYGDGIVEHYLFSYEDNHFLARVTTYNAARAFVSGLMCYETSVGRSEKPLSAR